MTIAVTKSTPDPLCGWESVPTTSWYVLSGSFERNCKIFSLTWASSSAPYVGLWNIRMLLYQKPRLRGIFVNNCNFLLLLSRSLFAGTCFVYYQSPAFDIFAIEHFNSFLRFLFGCHFDKSETS